MNICMNALEKRFTILAKTEADPPQHFYKSPYNLHLQRHTINMALVKLQA